MRTPTVERTAACDDPARFERWARFCDALGGFAPLEVTVASCGGHWASLDVGVWSKVLHPDRRAPSGTATLSAVVLAAEMFGVGAMTVAAPPTVAEFLDAAAAAATSRPRSRPGAAGTDQRRERFRLGGFEVTGSQLDKLASALEGCTVTVHADDRVDADRPAGPRSDRLRFGAAAEAAYHAFCERRGFELISADGSAEPDGEHRGTWAWAWWASPQRWRAGGGTGGTSLDAELTAAAAAVRDNPGRPIAVTFDCRNVVAAARGALATARTRGAARRLREAVEARGSHEPVVWLPLSSSMSVRQWHTDDLASWACHAAKAGRLGPWSPSEPLPMFPERARRRHPRSC